MSDKPINGILDELEGAMAKATQGKWKVERSGGCYADIKTDHSISGHVGTILWKDNAVFITLAHNHLPAITQELRRLQAVNAKHLRLIYKCALANNDETDFWKDVDRYLEENQ